MCGGRRAGAISTKVEREALAERAAIRDNFSLG
jgi:hypothetical protein